MTAAAPGALRRDAPGAAGPDATSAANADRPSRFGWGAGPPAQPSGAGAPAAPQPNASSELAVRSIAGSVVV